MAIMLTIVSCNPYKVKVPENDGKPGNQTGNTNGNTNGGNNATGDVFSKDEGVLRLVQYNVGSFSKYMTNSTGMIADMLLEMKADVCSVNETDSCNKRHNVYQVEELSKALGSGWDYTFGRAMAYQGGAYGNGVVANTAVLKKFNIILPKGSGSEQRSAAGIETEKYVYLSTHIDHKSSDAAKRQLAVLADEIKRMYGSGNKAVFVGGDFNMIPGDPTFSEFLKDFKMISVNQYTFGSQTPSKCIDYIFAFDNGVRYEVGKSAVPVVFSTGDVKKASDHLPVYVDVIIK